MHMGMRQVIQCKNCRDTTESCGYTVLDRW